MDATIRERLKTYIRKNEGLKLHPYQCSMGKWTWGYGHNFQDKPFTTEELVFILSNSIPEAIEYVLDNDVTDVLAEINKNFDWVNLMCPARQIAFADLLFNMGFNTLQGFKLMLQALRFADYKKASQELLSSLYANQVGLRAQNNATMILTGEFV